MFRSDNFNAVVSGLSLEGGYVEFWPKIRTVIAKHTLKICVLLAIYTYLRTVNSKVGFFVDDKIYYKIILFFCVLAFLYAFRKCQKIVSSGLIFHLYSVIANNMSLTSDINAMNLLFNHLDDAICLGSGENFTYRHELHRKPSVTENEPTQVNPHSSFRTLVGNASQIMFGALSFLIHLWPLSLLVLPVVTRIAAYYVEVKTFLEQCKQITIKYVDRLTSIRKRVWKKLSSTSRKSNRHLHHNCKRLKQIDNK